MTTSIVLVSSLCFSVTLHSNSETRGSHQPPTIDFIVQFSISVWWCQNCCPVPVRGTTSPTRAQCLQTISPAFALTGWVHFQSYLGQHLLSCPSGSWSHRFVIQLDYFITVCISSWIPHPPRWLLKFACMKIHSLCCKVLWVWEMHGVMYSPLQCHTE